MTPELIFVLIWFGSGVVMLVWFLVLVWKTYKHNKRMRELGLHKYIIGPF